MPYPAPDHGRGSRLTARAVWWLGACLALAACGGSDGGGTQPALQLDAGAAPAPVGDAGSAGTGAVTDDGGYRAPIGLVDNGTLGAPSELIVGDAPQIEPATPLCDFGADSARVTGLGKQVRIGPGGEVYALDGDTLFACGEPDFDWAPLVGNIDALDVGPSGALFLAGGATSAGAAIDVSRHQPGQPADWSLPLGTPTPGRLIALAATTEGVFVLRQEGERGWLAHLSLDGALHWLRAYERLQDLDAPYASSIYGREAPLHADSLHAAADGALLTVEYGGVHPEELRLERTDARGSVWHTVVRWQTAFVLLPDRVAVADSAQAIFVLATPPLRAPLLLRVRPATGVVDAAIRIVGRDTMDLGEDGGWIGGLEPVALATRGDALHVVGSCFNRFIANPPQASLSTTCVHTLDAETLELRSQREFMIDFGGSPYPFLVRSARLVDDGALVVVGTRNGDDRRVAAVRLQLD